MRLVLAACLLATVAWVTVYGFNKSTANAQGGRELDRKTLAKALAHSLGDRVAGPAPSADVLRIDGAGRFVGVSGRYRALAGTVQSRPCPVGAGLRDLADAAAREPKRVTLVVDPPGSCDAVVGTATPVSGGTLVTTRELSSVLEALSSLPALPHGARAVVIDPAGTTLFRDQQPGKVAPYLAPFARKVGVKADVAHLDNGRRTVFDAGAPLSDRWSVVVEENAASFDVSAAGRPTGVAIVAIAALFGSVVLLQALSDARRRAALRRSDAHTAAFIAVLGHELRTPLTVIKGFIDTLSARWDTLTGDQRRELVDRLPPQSRRLSRTVERLVLAANLQAGSVDRPLVSDVEIVGALDRIVDKFRLAAPLHEFVVDAPSHLTVRAEEKALEQILDQLVDNAVKYSPSGGRVTLAARRHRGHVDITVEDEGVGLPPDTTGIFDAFVQGEGVDHRVHDEGGVGVGLYIVRTLCEHLGGSVRAERRAQGGAQFVVTLRASRERSVVGV